MCQQNATGALATYQSGGLVIAIEQEYPKMSFKTMFTVV